MGEILKLNNGNVSTANNKNNEIHILDIAGCLLLEYYIAPCTTVKLQSLIYFSQVWHMVWENKKIFNQYMYACKNGVYNDEVQNVFTRKRGLQIYRSSLLTYNIRSTLDTVVNSYGTKSDDVLIALIKDDDAYRNALLRKDKKIDWNEAKFYYTDYFIKASIID